MSNDRVESLHQIRNKSLPSQKYKTPDKKPDLDVDKRLAIIESKLDSALALIRQLVQLKNAEASNNNTVKSSAPPMYPHLPHTTQPSYVTAFQLPKPY